VSDPNGAFIGYLHIKDVLALINDPSAVVPAETVRPLPTVAASTPVPDALSLLRRDNSHLALVVDEGVVTAVVALEDLVEDLVGTVRDGTHRV
jgi:CBS domain containing-hemolysin-like protein